MVTHRPKVKAENNLGGMCISLCPQAVCIPTGRYYSFIYLFQDSAVVPPFKTSCCDVLVNSLSSFCSVNCWKAFMHLKQQAFLAAWELITNASWKYWLKSVNHKVIPPDNTHSHHGFLTSQAFNMKLFIILSPMWSDLLDISFQFKAFIRLFENMKRGNILRNVNEVNTSNVRSLCVCVWFCVLLKIVPFFQHLIMASGLTIFSECLNVNELSRGSLLMASDYHLINAELRRSPAKLVLSDSWDSDSFHRVLWRTKVASCCAGVLVLRLVEFMIDFIVFSFFLYKNIAKWLKFSEIKGCNWVTVLSVCTFL